MVARGCKFSGARPASPPRPDPGTGAEEMEGARGVSTAASFVAAAEVIANGCLSGLGRAKKVPRGGGSGVMCSMEWGQRSGETRANPLFPSKLYRDRFFPHQCDRKLNQPVRGKWVRRWTLVLDTGVRVSVPLIFISYNQSSLTLNIFFIPKFVRNNKPTPQLLSDAVQKSICSM